MSQQGSHRKRKALEPEVLELLHGFGAAEVPRDLGSAERTHVFMLDRAVLKVYLQAGSSKPDRERAALELAPPGAPRVLDEGALASGRRWLLLERLPSRRPDDAGVSPDAHRMEPGFARCLGRLAADLHQVTVPAFGSWTVAPVQGPRDTTAR